MHWGDGDFIAEGSSAWNRTVDSSTFGNGDPALADLIKSYVFWAFPSTSQSSKSYSELTKSSFKLAMPNYDDVFPPNVVPDSPLPGFAPSKGFGAFCSFNLPLSLLQSSDEEDRELVFKVLSSGTGGHVTGGLVVSRFLVLLFCLLLLLNESKTQ